MSEIIGSLELEFLINNPEILNQLKQTEQNFQQSSTNIEAQLKATAVKQEAALAELTQRLTKLRVAYDAALNGKAHDPISVQGFANSIQITTGSINQLNAKIEQTKQSLKTIGIAPIQQLGNTVEQVTEKQGKFNAAIGRATDLQTIGARVVNGFSRQLFGLVTGFLSYEIGAKAIRALIDSLLNLDFFTGRLNQAKQNMLAFNEVMAATSKDAAQQTTSLKILYKAATDVTLSTEERTKAAQELKKEFPSAFANSSTMAILNGHEKKSFDDLSTSIIANARARAATAKIQDLENKRLDVDVQLQKIQNARDAQLERNKKPLTFEGGVDKNDVNIRSEVARQANQQAALASAPLLREKKILEGQQDFLTKLVGNKALVEAAINKPFEIKNPLSDFDKIVKNGNHDDLENLRKALQDKLNALAPNDAQIAEYQAKLRKLEEIEKKYAPKLNDGKAAAAQDAASAKAKIALLAEVANAAETYNRKGLTADQQALQAITDKFEALKQKITTFNADPKNKNHKIGNEVITKLSKDEQADISNQADLNENNYIKTDIEQKKKLYADYEAYKQKVGSETADREYAELLRSGKSWKEYLTNSKSAIDKTDLSGPMQARAELLNRYLLEALEEQKKALEALLIATTTYEEKRKGIIQAGIDAQKKLNDAGYADRAKQVARNTEDELTALDEANFKKLDAYRALFDNIDSLGTGAAKQQLNKLYGYAAAALATGQISIETFNRIIKDLDAGGKIVDDKLPKGLKAMGAELSSIASSVSGFDDNLYKALSTVAALVSGIGAMKENLNTINSKNSSSIEKVTSGLGLVGTAINVVTGVIGYFNRGKESALASAAELKRYQDQLIIGETQYNILLRNRASAQQDITKLTLNELQAREDMLALQKQQAQADYNALLQKIQASGQQINGEHSEKYGGILGIGRKTKVVQELAGLNGADYASLEKLYTEGKLDATTKAWFEQLQNVKNEMDSIGVSAKAAADQINKIATGTTADSIAQAIIDGFKQGKRSAADFADDFKSLMQNAAISVFQSNYLSGKIAAFYQQFADASANGGLTPAKIQALKDAYAKVIGDAGKAFGDLEKVLGTSLTTSSATSGTLSGAIKGITSTEANALEGSIHGMQLAIVQSNAILADSRNTQQSQLAEMRQQTLYQKQIVLNTGRTADNTDDMKVYLQQISANTSGSYGIDQRAAAHYGF
jgi:hypothetical protein